METGTPNVPAPYVGTTKPPRGARPPTKPPPSERGHTVVAVQLGAHGRAELVEAHEFVDLSQLHLVARTRRVALVDHLRDVTEDGGG